MVDLTYDKALQEKLLDVLGIEGEERNRVQEIHIDHKGLEVRTWDHSKKKFLAEMFHFTRSQSAAGTQVTQNSKSAGSPVSPSGDENICNNYYTDGPHSSEVCGLPADHWPQKHSWENESAPSGELNSTGNGVSARHDPAAKNCKYRGSAWLDSARCHPCQIEKNVREEFNPGSTGNPTESGN